MQTVFFLLKISKSELKSNLKFNWNRFNEIESRTEEDDDLQ